MEVGTVTISVQDYDELKVLERSVLERITLCTYERLSGYKKFYLVSEDETAKLLEEEIIRLRKDRDFLREEIDAIKNKPKKKWFNL